jgi:hypothetical protein
MWHEIPPKGLRSGEERLLVVISLQGWVAQQRTSPEHFKTWMVKRFMSHQPSSRQKLNNLGVRATSG